MQAFLLGAIFTTALFVAGLLYRVLRGPTAFDRLLAFNGINTQAILLLVLIGNYSEQPSLFIDVAFGYAALSLVGSIAAVKYLKQMDHSAGA